MTSKPNHKPNHDNIAAVHEGGQGMHLTAPGTGTDARELQVDEFRVSIDIDDPSDMAALKPLGELISILATNQGKMRHGQQAKPQA